MIKVITPPAVEPVSLSEAKLFLRVDATADDDLISGLIIAARQFIEAQACIRMVTQTLDLITDEFPTGEIYLEGPVQSVTSVIYINPDGVSTAADLSKLRLDNSANPAKVLPLIDESWPSIKGEIAGVAVRYIAGYGAAADVPAMLKQAIKMLVAHWYANREAVTENSANETPLAVDAIIKTFSRGIIQ